MSSPQTSNPLSALSLPSSRPAGPRIAALLCIILLSTASASALPRFAFASAPRLAQSGGRGASVRDATAGATLGGRETVDDKGAFLRSLDTLDSLNAGSEGRTALLKRLIVNRREVRRLSDGAGGGGAAGAAASLERPGSREGFGSVAPGTWTVVYAPHMTFMAGLLGGEFRVQYVLDADGTMASHARYDFPILNIRGYLSVSGTYSSEDDNRICRVDFDRAWVRPMEDTDKGPYGTLDDVPDSIIKDVINIVGRALFIEQFSVFPVSFLDDDLIVFDFDLLGTRICAKKTSGPGKMER